MTIAQEKPVAVRLPPDLRSYLKTQAKQNFRSLSSEIAMRLEESRARQAAALQEGSESKSQSPSLCSGASVQ